MRDIVNVLEEVKKRREVETGEDEAQRSYFASAAVTATAAAAEVPGGITPCLAAARLR